MKIFFIFLITFTVLIMGSSFFCAAKPAFSRFFRLQSKTIHLKQSYQATDSSFSKYWEVPLLIRKPGQFHHPSQKFEIWKGCVIVLLFLRSVQKKNKTTGFLSFFLHAF